MQNNVTVLINSFISLFIKTQKKTSIIKIFVIMKNQNNNIFLNTKGSTCSFTCIMKKVYTAIKISLRLLTVK